MPTGPAATDSEAAKGERSSMPETLLIGYGERKKQRAASQFIWQRGFRAEIGVQWEEGGIVGDGGE